MDSLSVEVMAAENTMREMNNDFYSKYSPQIRAIVARILHSANLARDIDDCVNNVFLELMEKLQQYSETRGSMGAFVAVIARSAALNYCRDNMRQNSELVGDERLNLISDPIEVENTAEFDMLVEKILGHLNERESVLFGMKFLYFYPSDEIAKAFKITRNAVDIRVNRLRGKIKKFLIKGGITI